MKQPVLTDLFLIPVEDIDAPRLASGLEEDTFTTSLAAAVSVDETKAQQRAQVYASIKESGDWGRTDDEIQVLLNLDGSSERPRRWELWKADRIQTKPGTRRLTRTGRWAVVWVAV